MVRRCHAQPLVVALALPLPAGGVPLPAAARREPRPGQGRGGVRAARHGGVRRGPLLRRRGPVRQGRARGHRDAGDGHQPRPRAPSDPRPADPVVPRRLDRRRGGGKAAPEPRRGAHRGRAPAFGPLPAARPSRGGRHGTAGALLHQHDQRVPHLGQRPGHAVPQGRDQRPRRLRRGHGRPGARWDQGRLVVPGRCRAGGDRGVRAPPRGVARRRRARTEPRPGAGRPCPSPGRSRRLLRGPHSCRLLAGRGPGACARRSPG